MNPIRTNKPVFFADDGEPLASGYIYVGLPGQDPRNFPKTVTFRDSGGGEFTAAQPLRTNGQGQISYNGKAIIALVEGDYSLLIEDRTGTQTKSGWTPTVTNSESGGSAVGETTRVGLLLSDIKLFDVSPGDTVRNVGKDTALDFLGADWLVVSNTGLAPDDSNLIDFSNGTQGARIKSQVYRRDIRESGFFALDVPIAVPVPAVINDIRNTWTNINLSSVVPQSASSANIRIRLSASYPNNTISNRISVLAYARKTGSGASTGDATRIGWDEAKANANEILLSVISNDFVIPLEFGSAPTFDIYIVVNDPTATANNTSPVLDINVVGYTINARDLV